MSTICYYLSAAMYGAGTGTSDPHGPLFQASAVLLLVAAIGFRYLTGDRS